MVPTQTAGFISKTFPINWSVQFHRSLNLELSSLVLIVKFTSPRSVALITSLASDWSPFLQSPEDNHRITCLRRNNIINPCLVEIKRLHES